MSAIAGKQTVNYTPNENENGSLRLIFAINSINNFLSVTLKDSGLLLD